MLRRVLFLAIIFAPGAALAQRTAPIYKGRLKAAGVPAESSPTNAVAVAAGVEVSKTAFIDGQNVCGAIRITNIGVQPAVLSAMADSLEVHFPGAVPPPPLPAGSTRTWFKVAVVPIPLPGPIAPRGTATIPYCFSLCLAADFTGANSMRNVVSVTVLSPSGSVKTVTTRSTSFPPPVLDCQACCLPAGSCSDTFPDDCAAAGGLPGGPGTDCATIECVQACCLPGASCSDRTVAACRAEGGAPLGLGTDCVTLNTTCEGACCTAIGCTDSRTVQQCDAASGTYFGNGTDCLAIPIEACPRGACCAAGTCYDNLGFYPSRDYCEAVGGAYLGDGTDCSGLNTTCEGACCTALGCTNSLTVQQCDAASGTYFGNGTDCLAIPIDACPRGACCAAGTCYGNLGFYPSRDYCEAVGGVYLGDGTDCSGLNATCEGACCTALGCTDSLTVQQCDAASGTYFGNGTDCLAIPIDACPRGACCAAGTCYDNLGQGYCEAVGGTYLGDGTTCTSTSCTEACCFGSSCEELDPGDCTAQGGAPQGLGSDCGFGPTSPCSVIAP